MIAERMELAGADRARYFIPTAICIALSGMCVALIVTSLFLAKMQDAIAVTVAGAFGLVLTGGLGLLFWRAQRHELLFTRLTTTASAAANFDAVRNAVRRAGWRIAREEEARRLDAQTTTSLFDVGERVHVEFHENVVLVASICDPAIGFSLVGRRHCAEHRELVRQALLH